MHDEIIRFPLTGEMSDSNIVEAKERLIGFLEGQMRDEGCVPVLDLEPQFTLDYRPERELFDFSLTVYGVYVGGDSAWETAGTMSGTKILRYTPSHK